MAFCTLQLKTIYNKKMEKKLLIPFFGVYFLFNNLDLFTFSKIIQNAALQSIYMCLLIILICSFAI